MKIIKYLLIALVVFISLPLIIALFTKKEYAVESTVTINQSKTKVFNYIKYLKNQDNYSVWAMRDPNMKKTFTGDDATLGFISRWESTLDDVGVGEQEILQVIDGERIDFELRFYVPFESTEKAFMSTEALAKNKTKVVWGFNGKMDYPMNLMLLFMDFEAMIGKDLQQGLNNLKSKMELSTHFIQFDPTGGFLVNNSSQFANSGC